MQRVRGLIIGAAVAALAVLASGCGSSPSDLVLIGELNQQQEAPSRLWAVDPGRDLDDASRVSTEVDLPHQVATLSGDGRAKVNSLGTAWANSALLSYGAGDSSRVTAGDPGEQQHRLAEATQVQAVVINRGVFISTTDGCRLATDSTESAEVGKGACSLSGDERWVMSWPSDGGELTIRDLRKDSTRKVSGLEVSAAQGLGHDARVLAIATDGDKSVGVLLDATNGDEVARTEAFDQMQIVPPNANSKEFVVSVLNGQESALLAVATDGEATQIDTGPAVVPVLAGHEVIYVRLEQDPEAGSIRRWSPGSEPEVLLRGNVGAGAVSPERFIATREIDGRVEFYRDDSDGMQQILTLATPTDQPVSSDRLLVSDSTALLQVTSSEGTSIVRLDMDGDDSTVAIRNWDYAALDSVDEDGTVLMTGARTIDNEGVREGGERLLVMGPADDRPIERARAPRTGTNLIHDGVVYYTGGDSGGTPTIRSVNAAGDRDPKLLYRNKLIVGALWDEQGGMFQSVFINRALLTSGQDSQSG